jgi:hypothetical protein
LSEFAAGCEQLEEVDGRNARQGDGAQACGKKARGDGAAGIYGVDRADISGPTSCTLEVEAPQGGKLRLEWRAVSATELAELIRAFVSR